jgi:hypothetical protein
MQNEEGIITLYSINLPAFIIEKECVYCAVRNRYSTTLKVNFGEFSGVVVKALRYKPTGFGFDSRWCHWNFSVT